MLTVSNHTAIIELTSLSRNAAGRFALLQREVKVGHAKGVRMVQLLGGSNEGGGGEGWGSVRTDHSQSESTGYHALQGGVPGHTFLHA